MLANHFVDQSADYLNRYVLRESFYFAPALAAVRILPGSGTTSPTAAAFAAFFQANPFFELLGTNAVSTCAAMATAGGGVTLTTTTASADQCIILPYVTTTGYSPWTSTLWNSAKSMTFETLITTGASVANYTMWAGYKLTNTSVVATDDDQAFFSLISGTSTRLQYTYSIAGVDVQVPVPTQISAAIAASTNYKLRIEVYSDRTHMGFVNDEPVGPSPFPALTSLTTFIPYIGVQTNTTAAKVLSARYLECSMVR